ncbi:hypothetical protein V6N12_006030 [Hibiscus sabdariffa]|uniref:RecA family profile 1 domain-containing protein n=1 Tax=Hibiscus sabdariffa TaxID=183260 RepID=A0ABR2EY32_9ROSI
MNNSSINNSRRNWQFSSEEMGSHAKSWLVEDETAREMLERVQTERPFLLLPPLHRVPIRVGNVVELAGPSSSSKTHILIQAAITCILPKQWNGVSYGGLGHSAMFIDLDCRFDISRFSELLNHRIMEAGSSSKIGCHKMGSEAQFARMKHYNEELFASCMKRFLYIRCYDSSEFLATLKTLHYRLRKEREAHGLNVHLLLIDSIGAFHWLDRGSSSFSPEGDNRKSWHLQNVSEAMVQEIRRLLLVHPMLVMATKAVVLGNKYSTNELTRSYGKWPAADNQYSRNVTSTDRQLPYREYMPAVWQNMHLSCRCYDIDDDLVNDEHPNNSVFLLEWLMPPANSLDKFTVTDTGVFILS